MSILNDRQIKVLCDTVDRPMINPFVGYQVNRHNSDKKSISYGLSSFGYDARLAPAYKIFSNINATIIDPLEFDSKCLINCYGSYCIIPPNSYILGRTVEYFIVPDNVHVIALAKSTYARCGLGVNVTPLEAGWEGHVTMELCNFTPLPLRVYANMGIAQFIFLEGQRPDITYAERGGKYQGQTGITLPRL